MTTQRSASSSIDTEALRSEEFPYVGQAPYLNAASISPVPERSRRATEQYGARRSRIHELSDDDFEPTLRRAREAAARLVGADTDEIALGTNTSFGINVAAQCLSVRSGSRVVLSDREFPTNVYPWMALGQRTSTRVDIIPTDAAGQPDEARLLTELERGDVGIFALSSVQFASGYAADLVRFGRMCCERGTLFVVDGIQSVGQIPMDVRGAEIDVLAVGGHKWLCSPFGTGFAYIRRSLHEQMEPRAVGWMAMEASADLSRLLDYRFGFCAGARKFEVATPPFQDLAGMTESISLLMEMGVGQIREHVLALLDPLVAWLTAHGVEIVSDLHPDRRSGILSFRPDDADASYAALQRAGIVCVLREGAIRVSPHLYNTPEEIQRVIDVLTAEHAT